MRTTWLACLIMLTTPAVHAEVSKLVGGFQFVEGPVWMPSGMLIFSDIPADALFSWDATRIATPFRKPSGQANGNTLDAEGRLITCEHANHRVVRMEKDGTLTELASTFEGKPLNSPNDVVVAQDGAIWFTDPTYGLGGRTSTQPVRGIYRLNPTSMELRRVAGADFDQPNGLCFSPDGTKLYVADSGKPAHVRVFRVGAGGSLEDAGIFCTIDIGVPDGIRCTADGRLWVAAGDGIQIFSADGKLERRILVPESPTNLAFGGTGGSVLYITARTSLYSVPVSESRP